MKKKKEVSEEVTPAEVATPAADMSEATTATVWSHSGGLIRIYSLEVHGAEFVDLAKQMAAQHPGSTIDVR